MKTVRLILVPVLAVALLGAAGAARADSFRLYYGSPGVSVGVKSGYDYYGHRGHYGHNKRHYRAYPRYWHGKRHGYWHGKRYGHYKHGFRYHRPRYGHGHRFHGRRHAYRGHRGWRH